MNGTRMIMQRVEGGIEFRGYIDDYDLFRTQLDPLDQKLIQDCEGTDRNASDWLLALETLFRRMEEQKTISEPPQAKEMEEK